MDGGGGQGGVERGTEDNNQRRAPPRVCEVSLVRVCVMVSLARVCVMVRQGVPGTTRHVDNSSQVKVVIPNHRLMVGLPGVTALYGQLSDI